MSQSVPRDQVSTSDKMNQFSKMQKCRPKLSPAQANKLTGEQRGFVDKLIRGMYKVHNSATVATNYFDFEVDNGRVRVNNQWHYVAQKKSSINYTVVGAVFKGIIGPDITKEPLSTLEIGIEPFLNSNTPVISDIDEPKDIITDEPRLVTPPKAKDKYEELTDRFHALRDYCEGGNHSDNISTGSLELGFKMLKQGFPVEACIHSLTINWPDTVRHANGIVEYDPKQYRKPREGFHKVSEYVADLMRAGVPTLLVGPTQSGKSTLAEHVSELLDLEYGGASPLTGGASPSWLLGRDSRSGFLPAPLINAYTEGKVYLLDEMDAADSNMLLVLNNAISNGHFDHPFLGRLEKHPNFKIIAAANTWGTGASREYVGRGKQDAAILERFRMGRVFLTYDRDLEYLIMSKYQMEDK